MINRERCGKNLNSGKQFYRSLNALKNTSYWNRLCFYIMLKTGYLKAEIVQKERE
jgi:hypothetical protein